MSSGGKSSEPAREISNFLRTNHRELDELLDKGETFTHLETEIGPSAWRRASVTGTIKRVEGGITGTEWELADQARKRLEEYREQKENYPEGTKVCPQCQYRGFANLRNGGYQCQNPQCEQEFEEFAKV